ncbi:hypothetical protein SLCG_1442 [Streptomyces lincolnensis]|uniref:hypothetical protein n=1 Tax=Streptomyces lincolnensis TaxID=1915 RepID=UPI00082B2F6D|nr:hypothetical protein [Streptomyces lincolnensis]AXG52597.1 hypothetical protein SLCG_1442 [Streptomyces lincolnensis]QMV05538.1 hypothetical protein GJU35_07695 [Streptomyces lincolnensis]
MDSAKHLARIDSLCSADLAAEHGGPDVVVAGPGYCVVSLEISHGSRTGDQADRPDTVDDVQAWKEHITLLLDGRWGPQQLPWGLGTLVLRIERGEEIPESWATMSALVDELNLWQPHGTDRWVALGVADRDPADEARLLALVTETDPP